AALGCRGGLNSLDGGLTLSLRPVLRRPTASVPLRPPLGGLREDFEIARLEFDEPERPVYDAGRNGWEQTRKNLLKFGLEEDCSSTAVCVVMHLGALALNSRAAI